MQWYEKLKFARKVMGLSLRQLEERTAIPSGHLSQLENGKIQNPSFFTVKKLLTYYHLTAEDIKDD